jgi:hypothetical protein
MEKATRNKSSKSAAKESKKRSSGFKNLIFIIILIFLVMILKMGVIFCFLALLPAIVAHYIDRTPTRYIFHTVFACNLAGLLPFIGQTLNSDSSNAELQIIMAQGINWLIIYSAAGFGWVMVFVALVASRIFVTRLHKQKVKQLDQTQHRILSEWGKEVETFHSEKMNSSLNFLPAPESPKNDA